MIKTGIRKIVKDGRTIKVMVKRVPIQDMDYESILDPLYKIIEIGKKPIFMKESELKKMLI